MKHVLCKLEWGPRIDGSGYLNHGMHRDKKARISLVRALTVMKTNAPHCQVGFKKLMPNLRQWGLLGRAVPSGKQPPGNVVPRLDILIPGFWGKHYVESVEIRRVNLINS